MRRESDGTYRLFQLLDVLMTAKDKVFVIDEISRCMHPLLTIKFVETFLRRDEVWLCENDGGTSRLYSLDEKQVRIDKVMDENYMEGTFGGIPRLG